MNDYANRREWIYEMIQAIDRDDPNDAASIAEKRQVSIDTLGERYLLHPNNGPRNKNVKTPY